MIRNLGHAGTHRRVALNVGSGFVPGLNSVLMGAALAGGRLGWEIVGIRDGFEGSGCSPVKAVRELGSDRRETGRSLSSVGVWKFEGSSF